jgi:fructose-1,6-bisphosphatase
MHKLTVENKAYIISIRLFLTLSGGLYEKDISAESQKDEEKTRFFSTDEQQSRKEGPCS